jgi:tetratricopeptide (TPR) repeat protein|tara:strand:- start:741 stop:1298 length:558 start_codon:yes stop_codon:yes gene_type:complete
MLVTKKKFTVFFLFFFISIAFADRSEINQLNKLFDSLSKTKNVVNGNKIEEKIWALWNKHPEFESLTDKLEFGTRLMHQGNFKFALQVFNNVIKSDPSWSEAWNKRATLLFLMKEYQKSLSDIEIVLNLEPRHFGALSGRAQIYFVLEKYQNAIEDLKKAKKLNPVIEGYELISELEKLILGLSI